MEAMSPDPRVLPYTVPATGMEVGMVVENDATGYRAQVVKIENGRATLRLVSRSELERIDKSFRPRWA